MAWSEAARKAAIEARRRNAKGVKVRAGKATVHAARKGKTTVEVEKNPAGARSSAKKPWQALWYEPGYSGEQGKHGGVSHHRTRAEAMATGKARGQRVKPTGKRSRRSAW